MVDNLSNYRGHKQAPRDLQICWANLRRGGPQHDSILNLAFEAGIDVLCVQEPWTCTGTRTKSHPAYHKFAPQDTWDWEVNEQKEEIRPRVLTYVRNSAGLEIQRRRPVNSRDLLWITVNGYTILNIYREPDTAEAMDYITTLVPPGKFILGGDFNLWHD